MRCATSCLYASELAAIEVPSGVVSTLSVFPSGTGGGEVTQPTRTDTTSKDDASLIFLVLAIRVAKTPTAHHSRNSTQSGEMRIGASRTPVVTACLMKAQRLFSFYCGCHFFRQLFQQAPRRHDAAHISMRSAQGRTTRKCAKAMSKIK